MNITKYANLLQPQGGGQTATAGMAMKQPHQGPWRGGGNAPENLPQGSLPSYMASVEPLRIWSVFEKSRYVTRVLPHETRGGIVEAAGVELDTGFRIRHDNRLRPACYVILIV